MNKFIIKEDNKDKVLTNTMLDDILSNGIPLGKIDIFYNNPCVGMSNWM